MSKLDPALLHKLTKRGVAEIIPEAEFIKRLEEGKPLRLKMGFDPSKPDLHLGHVVGLRKLRQLQELGHTVVLIVGDWTARIGDPSGQSDTRSMLDEAEVQANAETYMRQFFRIVDESRTEARHQTEWFGDFTLGDVVRLTSHFTVNQFLHRDDFAKRYAEQRPIAVTEMLYPLLQAYDSVAIRADVEFGGTDQLFNLMVGRELQEKVGQRPQDVFLMPILPGTDGVRRMGKSLGNFIAIEDTSTDMFGKIMSLPDGVVPLYFELLTDIPEQELGQMREAVADRSVNPMELKKRFAAEMVSEFHSPAHAQQAQAEFERVFQQREQPSDVPEFAVTGDTPGVVKVGGERIVVRLEPFIAGIGLAASNSEARRLVEQGAVEIDGFRVAGSGLPQVIQEAIAQGMKVSGDVESIWRVPFGAIVRVGRRRFVRLVRG